MCSEEMCLEASIEEGVVHKTSDVESSGNTILIVQFIANRTTVSYSERPPHSAEQAINILHA